MIERMRTDAQEYLIRQLPYPTVFLNRELEVVYASDSWIETFLFEKDNFIGRTVQDLIPMAPKRWLDILHRSLTGVTQTGTERVRGPGHMEFWYAYTNTPWFDEQENIVGILVQISDVTDQVLKEHEHEKTQILLQSKTELGRIGSWEYDVQKDKLFWCEMTKAIHEVPVEFNPNLETALNFYKEGYSRNTITQAVFKAIDTGEAWSEKLALITATGKEIWVIGSGKPWYKNGEYMGLIGTFQDVTEMTLSAQRIAESEKLLRTVIDNLPLNLYIKDLESRKTLVNKAECAYLGVSNASELLGKTDFELYPEAKAQVSRDEDLYVMNNGKAIIGKETQSVRKDGSLTHFLSSKIPLYNAENEVYGLMGISLDISVLKQKENELRELIDVTSQQNKKLVNFAHIVSHNLRSHSANFSMLLELLQGEQDPEETRRIVGMLCSASDNLMETLENLNEVVAINAQNNVKMTPVRPRQIAKRVEESLAAYLGANQAVLINDIPENTVVRAVPAYMESILTNFITNSVRYRHPDRNPEIRLSAKRKGHKLVLSIADNGLGMDLNKYGDKLFGMYKTFHDHPKAKGIGLYITKNQIEAMKASVMACSEVGQGTTFNIYFNETI